MSAAVGECQACPDWSGTYEDFCSLHLTDTDQSFSVWSEGEADFALGEFIIAPRASSVSTPLAGEQFLPSTSHSPDQGDSNDYDFDPYMDNPFLIPRELPPRLRHPYAAAHPPHFMPAMPFTPAMPNPHPTRSYTGLSCAVFPTNLQSRKLPARSTTP